MNKKETEAFTELEAKLLTKTNQYDVLNERYIEETKAHNEACEKLNSPHGILENAVTHFKANTFEMRGVSSSRILSMMRSARQTLRQATRK